MITPKQLIINVDGVQLKDQILSHLSSKTPLSIARFGDGEIIILEHKSDFNSAAHVFSTHVGNKNNIRTLLPRITTNLEHAFLKADIVGLPKPKKVVDTTTWARVPIFYARMLNNNGLNIDSKEYIRSTITYAMQTDGTFDELLSNIEELVIVNCNDLQDKFKKRFPNIKHITQYLIPPKFSMTVRDRRSKIKWNFFPDRHDEIKKIFLSQDTRGKLLLFGTGWQGKDLGSYFAAGGGVAFDTGAVFDKWAGLKTRGKGKGPGVIDLENAL